MLRAWRGRGDGVVTRPHRLDAVDAAAAASRRCRSHAGDEAAAVFNSACGNLLGVFVTPAWVQALLGSTSSVSFAATVIKLCYRVLAPLFVGQLTQYWLPSVAKWAKKHKPKLKKLQEHLLTFIVYVTFVKLDVGDSARFPAFSDLQSCEDGVDATSRRRDAVDVAVRESARRVREPRQFRDGVVRRRPPSRFGQDGQRAALRGGELRAEGRRRAHEACYGVYRDQSARWSCGVLDLCGSGLCETRHRGHRARFGGLRE